MRILLSRGVVGLVAGVIAAPILVGTFEVAQIPLAFALSLTVAPLYAYLARPERSPALDSAMCAATLGLLCWLAINVIGMPLLLRGAPAWNAQGWRSVFPELLGWVLYGAVMGGLLPIVFKVLDRVAPKLTAPLLAQPAQPAVRTRIVILGGGFGGMATAQALEDEFGADQTVSITLVSENNALLFTPMLAEVAASSLEPTHISTPLRTSLHRTNVIRARAIAVDVANRMVTLADSRSTNEAIAGQLGYDHLVITLGAVSNYFGNANMERHAFDFKSLGDAMRIRNHVIDMFERASGEPDVARRREMLTFVIAGAGFAGAELAGGLNDFSRGMLADYPNLSPDLVRVLVIHPRDVILPELSETLGKYAQERMTERGVTFMLNTRVLDAKPNAVVVSPGQEIPTRTLVWTAGTRPNPLLADLPFEKDKRGSLVVDANLQVKGGINVWAAGDCAAVTDAVTGKACPPTAQFALREAKTMAYNIHATEHGAPRKGFHFKALGMLCVVGHHTACAEMAVPFTGRTVRFSGLLAWLVWRAVYLAKLPGLERKVRVMTDWVIELFFPRDIVQTID